MGKYSEGLNRKIRDFYKQTGSIEQTEKLCHALLVSNTHKSDKNFLAQIHGEVCESLLECIIVDFILKHNLKGKWFYEKGLILKDPYAKSTSPYMTELDLTLFTPYKILTIECKCYGGDKILADKCTIKRKGKKSFDIYAQHKKHYKVLISNLSTYRYKNETTANIAPLQIGYFNYSLGSIKDERTKEWRMKMPLLTYENITKLLELYLDKPTCWNMDRVRKAVNMIAKDKNARKQKHLEYVKNLHH